MTNDTNSPVVDDHQEDKSKNSSVVTITIDNKLYEVQRGHQTVIYLKELGGIPQTYELDELKNGKLHPLDDNASVNIKGGEIFKSNLKIGHSS